MIALIHSPGCTASKTPPSFVLLWLHQESEQKPKANSQQTLEDSSSLGNFWFHSVIQPSRLLRAVRSLGCSCHGKGLAVGPHRVVSLLWRTPQIHRGGLLPIQVWPSGWHTGPDWQQSQQSPSLQEKDDQQASAWLSPLPHSSLLKKPTKQETNTSSQCLNVFNSLLSIFVIDMNSIRSQKQGEKKRLAGKRWCTAAHVITHCWIPFSIHMPGTIDLRQGFFIATFGRSSQYPLFTIMLLCVFPL